MESGEMLDAVKEYWIKWLCGIGALGIGAAFKKLYSRQKEVDTRQDAIEKGLQALLRDRIIDAYYHYQERGNITLHGLEAVNLMYTEYHNLGGNGTVTKLMNDLHELEVVDN